MRRRQEKKQEDLHIEKKVVSEAGSEAPPETLADKVAQERKGLGRSELATELSCGDSIRRVFGQRFILYR